MTLAVIHRRQLSINNQPNTNSLLTGNHRYTEGIHFNTDYELVTTAIPAGNHQKLLLSATPNHPVHSIWKLQKQLP